MNVFNNVILARNRQLADDDRMIETSRSIFKSFNINNLSVCIGWCTDQVTLRSARCNDKDDYCNCNKLCAFVGLCCVNGIIMENVRKMVKGWT